MPDQLDHHLDGARESTRRLMASLQWLTNADVHRPSFLPGWSNGHVLTHLARNADGMATTLDGALRGVVVPMYPHGDAGRNEDIEQGAGRDAAALVADLNEAAGRLDDAWSRMDAAAWQRIVVPRMGEMPAWQLLPARRREVEIHRVDLNLPPEHDYRPDAWPAGFVADLVGHLVETGVTGRLPADLTLSLAATDTGARWTAGSGPRRAEVSGPAWALGCWLAGRTARIGDALAGDPLDLGPWR